MLDERRSSRRTYPPAGTEDERGSSFELQRWAGIRSLTSMGLLRWHGDSPTKSTS